MDDGRDEVDVRDLEFATTTESDSSWRTVLLSDGNSVVDNHPYFFGTTNDRDSTILSEFGWNLPPPHSVAESSCGSEFHRIIESDLAGNDANCYNSLVGSGSTTVAAGTTITTSISGSVAAASSTVASAGMAVEAEHQPMVSSSSSEDQPEKSTTTSVGSADMPPAETA